MMNNIMNPHEYGHLNLFPCKN